MIGGLVPGFKGAGHPDKVNRREERRRVREEQCRRDEEYMETAGFGAGGRGGLGGRGRDPRRRLHGLGRD